MGALLLAAAMAAGVMSGVTCQAEENEKIVVTMWTNNRHDATFIQEKIDEYNASNPDNIEVRMEVFTDNYAQAVDMAYQSGATPDMFNYQGSTFEKYVHEGKFLPLNECWSDEFAEKFSECMFDGINVIDGNTYYIPTTGSNARLIYNKDIFEKAGIEKVPKTLDETVEAARTITEKLSGEGIYGFALNMKSPASALDRSLNYESQVCLGIRDGFDLVKGEYDFSSYVPLLEKFKELLAPDVAFPGCESLDIDPLRAQFADGKIGMYMSYSGAEPGVYANQFPTEQNWGVAPLPTLDGTVVGAENFDAVTGVLINAESPVKDAAWKAYEAIWTNDDFLTGYFENGYGISIMKSVQEKAELPEVYVENPDLLIGENDKVWPKTPMQANASAMIVEGQDRYNVFADVIAGNVSAEDAVKDLTERYNAAYRAGIEEGIGKEIKIPDFDPMNPLK